MRILVDYRPALRARSGVGEYVHHLVRAFTRSSPDTVALFTSSWKDRPMPQVAAELGAETIDRRIPNRLLNFLWHRAEWPSIESLAGPFDVVHSAHPLLIPARQAAQVVTIHDLFFLSHREQTRAEIKRDYAPLVRSHARRAHAVITSTEYGRELVVGTLGVDASRVYVCSPGPPDWRRLGHAPNVPADGYVLFLGTLEPRKNLGTLLDAWELLIQHRPDAKLLVAGRATPAADSWLRRMSEPALSGSVTYRGYVTDDERESLYAGARALVLPSLDEGFGLTALEAMSAGVPLVASSRGSLPEVTGRAAVLVDAADAGQLADALEKLVTDQAWAVEHAQAGLARAAHYSWAGAAATLRQAYLDAAGRRKADRTGS